MSTKENKNFEDQEIDLTMLSDKISGISNAINKSIFLTIQFVLKHIVILGILFVVGVGLGVYLDMTQKKYINEIIIRPNFESTDYAYSKIELLRTKIKERDTSFLKSIGIQNPSEIENIQIAPIVDVYKFIGNTTSKENDQNFQILKLLAEDGDMEKIVTEKLTSKNYPFHKITLTTKVKTSRKATIEPILNYLENSDYFTKLKNVYQLNIQNKLQRDNEIISQIDDMLNSFSKEGNGDFKSDKLVYYNENTQLNDIIISKRDLVSEITRLEYEKQNTDKVLKEISTTINILNTKSINGKKEFILPLLLIFIYISISLFIKFYKKQALLHATKPI